MASLKQIKIFPLKETYLKSNLEISNIQNDVNRFIVDIFNKTGNYPNIKTNSKYIAVIYEENNIGNYPLEDTNTKSINIKRKRKPIKITLI